MICKKETKQKQKKMTGWEGKIKERNKGKITDLGREKLEKETKER